MYRFTEIAFYIPNDVPKENHYEFIQNNYQNQSLILIIGRENNNIPKDTVVEENGYYNFYKSPPNNFYKASLGFLSSIINNNLNFQKFAEEKDKSQIIFSNASPIPIPNDFPNKEKIRKESIDLIDVHWEGIFRLINNEFPLNCKVKSILLSYLTEREMSGISKVEDYKQKIVLTISNFCKKYQIELFEIPYLAAPISYKTLFSYLDESKKEKLKQIINDLKNIE